MTRVTGNSPTTTPSVNTTPSSTGSSKPAAGGSYTVKPGDTLWALAQKVYGDGNRWREIAEANPQLQNGSIKPGDTVKLPAKVQTDKVAGDASADAKKVIDDGKPKGDGTTPQGDPALQGGLSTMRSLANAGGRGTPAAGDKGGDAPTEDKDVNDEAIRTHAGKKVYGNQVAHNFWQPEKPIKGTYVNEGKGWKKIDDKEKVKDADKLNIDATLVSATGTKSVAAYEKKLVEGENGSISFHAGKASATGTVSAGADLRNLTANVSASGRVELHAVGIEGKGKVDTALGTTSVKGKAYVGAEVGGNASVKFDPRKGTVVANAGVDAFAGVKASLDLNQSVKVGGHEVGSVGAKGEVYAGIGVKANAEVGFEKGKVKASFELGAALGVGAGIKVNVEVDVVGTAKAAVDVGKKAVNAVGDGAKAVWNGIKSLW